MDGQRGQSGKGTAEEEALCGVEEPVLALGAGDGVEAADADNLLDGVAGAVVGVRVCAQDAAEIGFEPQLVGGYALVAALVDAVALDGAGDVDLDAHVEAGEGIVAAGGVLVGVECAECRVQSAGGGRIPVEARDDLGLLVVGRVGEGVDVGGQAGRGRGVDARDVVVDARLPGRRLEGLLDEVDQVGRAELAQRLERLGARLNGRVQLVLVDSAAGSASVAAAVAAQQQWQHTQAPPGRRPWLNWRRAGRTVVQGEGSLDVSRGGA